MAECKDCQRAGRWITMIDGRCGDCYNKFIYATQENAHQQALDESDKIAKLDALAETIILTTETAPDLSISERLDIITAECVIGMHLFKDVAAIFRDALGGRSKTMQSGLRDARKIALTELRREAAAMGADAVVGVALDYSEISGGGKSMLFLVASGTAVTLKPQVCENSQTT